MAIANKAEAQAFLAALNLEADGLPPANLGEAAIADWMHASTLVGKQADFLAYLGKVKGAAKDQGKALGRKSECPLTKEELAAFAVAGDSMTLIAVIGGKEIGRLECEPRQFSTGGFGYSGNGKLKLAIGDKTVVLQCTPNFSIVNSKLVQ